MSLLDDHSRVVLKNPDGISDYINANFVDVSWGKRLRRSAVNNGLPLGFLSEKCLYSHSGTSATHICRFLANGVGATLYCRGYDNQSGGKRKGNKMSNSNTRFSNRN